MKNNDSSKVTGKIELGKERNHGRIRPPKGSRSFAILRVAKIGGKGGGGKGKLAAAALHNFRERDTPNADPERFEKNRILAGATNAQELRKKWEDLAPEKVRTNAVWSM